MAVGLNESFWLYEQYGSRALTTEEILFMASARKKRGCKLIPCGLTQDERARVLKLGKKIKKWRAER